MATAIAEQSAGWSYGIAMAGRPFQFRLQTLFILTAEIAGGLASLRCIGEAIGGPWIACLIVVAGALFGSAIGLPFGAGRLGAVIGVGLAVLMALFAMAIIGANC